MFGILRLRFLVLVLALFSLSAVLPVASASAAGPGAVQDLPGCTESSVPANDDGSLPNVPLPFAVNYFGNEFNSVNINNNGNVTFDNPVGTFTPYDFTVTGESIIAPFLADVDTRVGTTVTYGAATVDGHPAFCVDWVDVGYYSDHTDKTNSFQLLLIAEGPNPGDFVIRLNYDRIAWETGDASGGTGGFGGTSAAVGYSSGDGDPEHFLTFAGSFVNGALLDGGPNALIAGTLNAGGQLGRYNFAVVNAPPTGATLTGQVLSPGSTPLSNAPVEICPVGGGECEVRFTNSSGVYRALNLPAGEYTLLARAPAGGAAYANGHAGPVAVSGLGSFNANVTLGPAPGAPPAGTEITHIGESPEGVPTAYWQEPLTLSTEGCPGATVGFEIIVGGTVVRSGTLAEGPSGHYEGTTPPLYPNHGEAEVKISIDCPTDPDTTIEFGIYIDPSGVVRDAVTGAPIAGATVTLFRSAAEHGPFVQVPDGSAIMSPGNRVNPDVTGPEGTFGWEVIAGFYEVEATAPGCDPATSSILRIPPPVTDLSLGLQCGSEVVIPPPGGGGGGSTGGATGSPPPPPVPPTAPPTPKKHKKHKKHKRCVKKKHGHKVKCKGTKHKKKSRPSGATGSLTAPSPQQALMATGTVPLTTAGTVKPR